MSEMLGNQYFLGRNFHGAEKEYEECLAKYPDNKILRKKIIICYTQTGKYKQAIDEFLKLIQEDIDFVINTDIIGEDCPCTEIIFELEKNLPLESKSSLIYSILGIIWSYCDIGRGYDYFQKALKMEDGKKIEKICSLLELKLKEQNKINIHEDKIKSSKQGGTL
jgi:tetratricopeptide (TPR) repeat protein